MGDFNCFFEKYYPEDTAIIKVPKGRTIFMPYQPADYIYHLHSGIACTLVADKKGGERLSLLILPNQFMGLAGFVGMDGNRHVLHTGEARAVTPIVYCKVRRELVWKLTDNWKVRAQIYNMINSMLVINSYCGLNLVQGNVHGRVYFLLNILALNLGVANKNGAKTVSGITHSDIALLTNSTRATVSRALKKLEGENHIIIHRNRIDVFNPLPFLKSAYP